MGVIEMQDTKVVTVLCPYYMNALVTRNGQGGFPKAPLFPIVAMVPLDLLHVDFTSIEIMLEPNQSPRVAILVFQDHFTKHMLVYMTPVQTAKTVAKFLCGGFISIFGATARLLSDRGANFTSSVIEEMCKILGIK